MKPSEDKKSFNQALNNIERFVASYYPQQIKIHLRDDVIESITRLRHFLGSLLRFEESELTQTRVIVRQLLDLNVRGGVDFGHRSDEIRDMLNGIVRLIRSEINYDLNDKNFRD